jgi:hypothetical protein
MNLKLDRLERAVTISLGIALALIVLAVAWEFILKTSGIE